MKQLMKFTKGKTRIEMFTMFRLRNKHLLKNLTQTFCQKSSRKPQSRYRKSAYFETQQTSDHKDIWGDLK